MYPKSDNYSPTYYWYYEWLELQDNFILYFYVVYVLIFQFDFKAILLPINSKKYFNQYFPFI